MKSAVVPHKHWVSSLRVLRERDLYETKSSEQAQGDAQRAGGHEQESGCVRVCSCTVQVYDIGFGLVV